METPVVSTEGRRPEWRDLRSTISRLLWREGLSTPRFALRSRRRKLPYAIALPALRRVLINPNSSSRLGLCPLLGEFRPQAGLRIRTESEPQQTGAIDPRFSR